MSNWWANKLGKTQPQRTPHPYAPRGLGGNVPPRYPQPPAAPENFERSAIWQMAVDNSDKTLQGREGAAETAQVGNCPACGSNQFFSRRSGAVTTANGVMYPRPECFECGYPTEQGTLGTSPAATGIVKVVSGHRARQGDSMSPADVVGMDASSGLWGG